MKPYVSIFAATLLAAFPALAETGGEANPPGLGDGDRGFFAEAAKGGTNKVVLSQLGAAHSDNSEVKALAEMMITDHQRMNADLSELASLAAADQ